MLDISYILKCFVEGLGQE